MAISLKKKIKTIFSLNYRIFKALLSQKYSGYLIDVGWFNSFSSNSAVDGDHQPIPWTTYPFFDFIKERLTKEMRVFEYGSGNSTLYFAKHVRSVTSVEHNPDWFRFISENKPGNVEVILSDLANDEYCRVIQSSGDLYDLIIVDGENRDKCLELAILSLSDKGVIILDDSERIEYQNGINFLFQKEFKKLDFWGIAPTVLFKKCTTIFYRDDNCLGI